VEVLSKEEREGGREGREKEHKIEAGGGGGGARYWSSLLISALGKPVRKKYAQRMIRISR